jgi:hypothetical protein
MTDNNQGDFGFKTDVGTWTRTCQECGHKTKKYKQPKGEPSDAYCNARCPHCKSEALDYGSLKFHKDPLEDLE